MPALLAFVALVALAALPGVAFEPGGWYASLDKPAWTPPASLFGPVWAALYAAVAVAGWALWRRTGGRFTPALGLWGAQLVLNAAWSWIFFGLHRPGWALLDIGLLFACIVAFIWSARRASPLSAALFVPYALWVGFATVLLYEIRRLTYG
ncbi:MAG: tryptophan-rich sensory protein [Thermoanaerobaculia bacterium]|nr:tryptophan-rich sensory protein [Thermoanaerobaculia bacterium]